MTQRWLHLAEKKNDTGSPGKTAGDALMRMSQRLVLLVADFVGNTGQRAKALTTNILDLT